MKNIDLDTFNPDTDMRWSFKTDDYVEFNTVQSDLIQYNGTKCTVLRRVTKDEADLFEVGPMYVLDYELPNGQKLWAFEDELSATSELRFEQIVDTYRALGYRMVVFDCPNGASWLCAFNTSGRNADSLPIEAFADEGWLHDLRHYASWSGPIEDVEHMDVTDDIGEMLGGYDYEANYPVIELVSDYR